MALGNKNIFIMMFTNTLHNILRIRIKLNNLILNYENILCYVELRIMFFPNI